MSRPLPVLLALAGAVSLSALGLSDFMGLLRAAEGLSLPIVGSIALGIVAIIAGGELFKSKGLEHARDAETAPQRGLAFVGFLFFACVSVTLEHQGLLSLQRTLTAPIIAPLDKAVSDATVNMEAATTKLRQAIADEDARASRLDAEIASAPTARERAQLRAERDALEDGRAGRLKPYQDDTVIPATELRRAQLARSAAPKGFAELSLPLPFGWGSIAFVAWLIAGAIEFLTSAGGWIASRRATTSDTVITHADVLMLDVNGLDLIDDLGLLDELASFHAACAGKLRSVRAKKRSMSN